MDDVTQKREKFFKNVRYGSVGILAVLLVPLIFFLSVMAAGAVAAAWIAVVGLLPRIRLPFTRTYLRF